MKYAQPDQIDEIGIDIIMVSEDERRTDAVRDCYPTPNEALPYIDSFTRGNVDSDWFEGMSDKSLVDDFCDWASKLLALETAIYDLEDHETAAILCSQYEEDKHAQRTISNIQSLVSSRLTEIQNRGIVDQIPDDRWGLGYSHTVRSRYLD